MNENKRNKHKISACRRKWIRRKHPSKIENDIKNKFKTTYLKEIQKQTEMITTLTHPINFINKTTNRISKLFKNPNAKVAYKTNSNNIQK